MAKAFRPAVDRWLVSHVLIFISRIFTRWRVYGELPQPVTQPRIYYSNHSSHLDGLMLWSSFPARQRALVHPVAARDYWGRTLLRRYLASRIFEAVLIERHAHQAATASRLQALQMMETILNDGKSLILFPEGTRGDGRHLSRFKSSIWYLAQHCPQAALIPVWLENLHHVLPKGARKIVPAPCSATFGTSVPGPYPGESKEQFLQRLQQALLALRPA